MGNNTRRLTKIQGANQKIAITNRNSNQRLDKFLFKDFLYTRGNFNPRGCNGGDAALMEECHINNYA